MRVPHPGFEVAAAVARARAVVQALDEALATVQATVRPLPVADAPPLSAAASARIDAEVRAVEQALAVLEAERATLEADAAGWAHRVALAGQEGAASRLVAQAEQRRDETSAAAAAAAEELTQMRAVCARATQLLDRGERS